jgi:hypothetical protein
LRAATDIHIETKAGVWHGRIAFDVDGAREPWADVRTFI